MASKAPAAEAATTDYPPGNHVLFALRQVRKVMNAEGIAKAREVTEGTRFKFRGIDDVMDNFSGPMDEHLLLAVPSYPEITVTERKTANGKANWNTRVTCTITFTSLLDGSQLLAGPFHGEANDTQDKSASKAQSIAYRVGMLLTFVVPLGPDMDPEAGQQPEPDDVPANQQRAQPRSREGQLADPLTASQTRILQQKLKNAGAAMEQLVAEKGEISSANFNDAMDWIKGFTS